MTDALTAKPATASGDSTTGQFAADVREHLARTPRQLPPRYLYDELGSALFEAICRLPWYGITRAESRLLMAHRAEVLDRIGPLTTVVELGPGTGEKLRLLLDAPAPRRSALRVHLVDVSHKALDASARTLDSLADVEIAVHHAAYDAGLRQAVAGAEGRTLVAFLGSNIGNFDPPDATAFLRGVRAALTRGDALLVGADLVKPERALLLAYDDPLGITAAFNRNLLVRINRELDGNFDLGAFSHRAAWNGDRSRVEMHLVARAAQHVRIGTAEVELRMARGEVIWTESSYKHTTESAGHLLTSAGFTVAAQWIDRQDAFALTLAEAV